jgi:hypothetical protein
VKGVLTEIFNRFCAVGLIGRGFSMLRLPRREMPRLHPEQVGAEEPHLPQSHRGAGTPGSRSSQPFRVVISAVKIVSGFVLLEFSLGRGGRSFFQQCGDFAFTHRLESARGIERLIKDLH